MNIQSNVQLNFWNFVHV